MQRIIRPLPPPPRLRSPQLPIRRLRHPDIPLPQRLRPRPRNRRADLDFISELALEGLVAHEHVEEPEGQRGSEAAFGFHGDGAGELEEAEVGRLVSRFGAHADADEFDFGYDEAVAAAVLAHLPLQLGQGFEVVDFALGALVAHACVPVVVGFDDADDAGAGAMGHDAAAGEVGGVVGGEVGAVFWGALGGHGDVALVALAGLEGSVDFGGVELGEKVVQVAVRGWLKGCRADFGSRERGCRDRDVEKAGEIAEAGETWD